VDVRFALLVSAAGAHQVRPTHRACVAWASRAPSRLLIQRLSVSVRHLGEPGQPGHARPHVLGQTLPSGGDGGGAGQFRWDASRVE